MGEQFGDVGRFACRQSREDVFQIGYLVFASLACAFGPFVKM